MFENIINFFKNLGKSDKKDNNSKDTAKERLHLVLMQDRANVSADFLDLMRQEIIDVIKKYVEVDETDIDVRMTNRQNDDGTNGAPALYANIPITNIKNDILVEKKKEAEKIKVQNEGTEQAQENIQENAQVIKEEIQETFSNEQEYEVSIEENNEPKHEVQKEYQN